MRGSYDIGVKLTLGLEGKGEYTDDPDDPGKGTKYGISAVYNPEVDVKNLTLEKAKDIYYRKYWVPAGCNEAPFPMDICLFDSFVNPQRKGNKELLDQNPKNWQEYQIFRMQRYMRYSKEKYVKGHVFRVLKLCAQIKKLIKENENEKSIN